MIEDQHDDRIGNIYMTLIGADERRPRLVLVWSEEINWFTKLEKVVWAVYDDYYNHCR